LLDEGEEHWDFSNKKLLAQRLFEVVRITYEVAKKRGFISVIIIICRSLSIEDSVVISDSKLKSHQ